MYQSCQLAAKRPLVNSQHFAFITQCGPLIANYRQRLAEALPDYILHTSCKNPATKRDGQRAGAAGLAIAIHKKLTTHASISLAMLNSQAAAGHCQMITLHPPGSDTIDIWGVYIPWDRTERRQVYEVLRENLSPDRYTILAGDMNAAYTAADRSSGTMTTDDKAHHQIVNELHMQPSEPWHRAPQLATYVLLRCAGWQATQQNR